MRSARRDATAAGALEPGGHVDAAGCAGRRLVEAQVDAATMASAVASITIPSARCTAAPRAGAADARRARAGRRAQSASSTTRRPGRVGERDGDRPPAGGADGDDRGEDRARARRVDEAERAADSSPEAKPSPRERGPRRDSAAQRRLERAATPGSEQRRAEARERGDRHVSAADPRRGRRRSTTSASPAIVTVKVTDRPRTIPSGRRRPPVAAGRQQRREDREHTWAGAVPAPASTAKASRMSTLGASVVRGQPAVMSAMPVTTADTPTQRPRARCSRSTMRASSTVVSG